MWDLCAAVGFVCCRGFATASGFAQAGFAQAGFAQLGFAQTGFAQG